MTDPEIAARGQRAEQFKGEFLDPILTGMRDEYVRRIADVATKELDPKVRADKITALSVALRVVDNVTSGIDTAIQDGFMAQKNLMKAEEIEQMGPTRRKLFSIAPTY